MEVVMEQEIILRRSSVEVLVERLVLACFVERPLIGCTFSEGY